MLINHSLYSETLNTFFPNELKDKPIYNFPLSTLNPSLWDSLFKDFVWDEKKFKGVILDAFHEAPEEWRVRREYLKLINLGVPPEKIMWIDSGFTPETNINHVSIPMFLNSYSNDPTMAVPVKDRSKLFLILARDPKFQRVKFVLEILSKGLDKHSVLTCGSSDSFPEDRWSDLVPIDNPYFGQFPILLNSKKAGFQDVNTIEPEFKECLFNVVLETGFEAPMNNYAGWDRQFYTEKTGKAFFLDQIPIFLAKKGYVKIVRDLGFDVFDDIVDHGYDDIDDPFQRITAVANECMRLSLIGLDKLKSKPSLPSRFNHNKMQRRIVSKNLGAKAMTELQLWIRTL